MYFFLYRNKKINLIEGKIEQTLSQFGKKGAIFSDILVLILVLFYTIKVAELFYTYPISCRIADMLPIIRGAGEFLLSFENPFNKGFCPWDKTYPYFPMMLVYYIPAVLLKLDIRFLSYLFLLGALFIIYGHYRKRGLYLTGLFIFFMVISSKLFLFYLTNLHTFPYLFILTVILFSLLEKKDGLFFFTLALALATRRTFWFFLPVFLIYFLKQKKINFSNLKYFILGSLLSCSPVFLYPKAYINSLFDNFHFVSQSLQQNIFLKHSLGMAYYLQGLEKFAVIFMLLIFAIIYVFAIRFVKDHNLWFFLFLIGLSVTYLQARTRPQEYYFLPLVVFVSLSPAKYLENIIPKTRTIYPSVILSFVVLFILIFQPFLSGREYIINPIRGNVSVSKSGYITSNGYVEVSIGGNFRFKRNKKIVLLLRRINYEKDKPVSIKIDINQKNLVNKVYNKRVLEIVIEDTFIDKYFYIGSNDLEVMLTEPEAFSLKIFPTRSGSLQK